MKDLRRYHEAKWDESIIFEQSVPGCRGILMPEIERDIQTTCPDKQQLLPESLKRKRKPELPEMAQTHVLRHFLRLSQETIGQDLTADIGLGTCTMKYSPKINEQFIRSSKFSEMHPYQDDTTAQGILKIIYDFEQIMKEISGLDAVSFQAGGGGMGIYSNAAILKQYFRDKGEDKQRTQVITTILSHPLNAAAPATKGFEVVSLFPDENGYPSIDALKAAVCEKTAGIFITNPEDTGVFNPYIKEFINIVHEAGGLCICDMADYNGLFGLMRAKEWGADMCHFNLHKAFSSPHACMGPGCAAQCVRTELEKYLPRPRIRFDGTKYYTDYEGQYSIGRVREFHGVLSAVVRAYSWVMTLGADGLKTVGETAVLNNNYMMKRVLESVKGITIPWSEKGLHRLEQVRYSFEKLCKDTGVTLTDINNRMLDFGYQRSFASHHPMIVTEPYTPEPTESYSKADIDEYVDTLSYIADEAYTNPSIVKSAPHNSSIHRLEVDGIDNAEDLCVTWRAYKKHNGII